MDTKYKYINSCPAWDHTLSDFLESEEGQAVKAKVSEDRQTKSVFPTAANLFRAFKLTPWRNVKVVILGQDPYPNDGADGLAFSSTRLNTPPSLQNIFAEILRTEYGAGVQENIVFPNNNLAPWAQQGVLLLNTALTVISGKPKSHADIGWDKLIVPVIQKCNTIQRSVVFMLWGTEAQTYEKYLDNKNHLVLKGYHPQAQNYPPYTAKFVGNDHFKKTTAFFAKRQIVGINWRTL